MAAGLCPTGKRTARECQKTWGETPYPFTMAGTSKESPQPRGCRDRQEFPATSGVRKDEQFVPGLSFPTPRGVLGQEAMFLTGVDTGKLSLYGGEHCWHT